MDRKSLGVALLERGDVNEIRSVRRRSAAVPRTNSDPLETYDDSAERERARQESAAASPASTVSSSRRSLNLGAVAQLSSGQIADGIAECIKLNNENKINKKNAFSLKMIDFMTYLIKNRDETMSNLTMASTSLDVSAKIYGLRVDVLHNETMNIVGNLDNERQEAEDGEEDGPSAESGPAELNQSQVKKKKKKRSTKIFTTIEALCCEPEVIKLEPPMLGDGDFQTTDMLLQVTAPRHVGLGVGIHPYNDHMLDEPKATQNSADISYEPVKIPAGRQIGSIFTEFDFLNWDTEYDPENSIIQTENQQQAVNEFAFDLETSFHDDDGHFVPTAFDANDSNAEEAPAAAFAAPRPRELIADVNEIFERISARDYSYFDDAFDIRWKAGAQWAVKTAPKALSASHVAPQRQEAARRKKDFSVDFEAEIDDELEAKFAPMKKTKVKRTPRNFEDRWTEPAEERCDAMALCQFWSRPDDVDLQPRRHREEAPEPQDANFDDYNDLDDSHHFDEPAHDASMDQNDVAPTPEPESDDFASGGFTGANLVEAPKATEKIYIPFSQRAKKLNMKHLKSCIWSSVHAPNDDKENVGRDEVQKQSGPRTFADVYLHLPEKLSKNDAKELTFPIAFVSLLHLANEKCLKLSNTDSYDDILVELDTPA